MKCTKTFTLEIVVTATCPVFDAELDLLAAPVDQGAFAAYADSATPGVPHKYFASFGTNLVVINADTQALIATDPNPGAYSSYNDATVGQASSRLYRFLWNGLAVFVDAMDIDTYAHTTTASLGVGWTGTHLVYDSVHNQLLALLEDAAGNSYLRLYHPTTLATVATHLLLGATFDVRNISYDPTRDWVYAPVGNAGLATYELRAWDRSTGAQVISQ